MRKSSLDALLSVAPDVTVEGAARLFCQLLGAATVELFYADGPSGPRRIQRTLDLQRALQNQRPIELRVCFKPSQLMDDDGDVASAGEVDPAVESLGFQDEATQRSNDAAAMENVTHPVCDAFTKRFIQELDRQERRRKFIWAGFVVNDLLPKLGAEKREAQTLFDRMVNDGIVSLNKMPNPKNPEFPTTRVQINHDHPSVKEALKTNGRSGAFQPVPVRGEPASVTLIRDRR